MLLKDKQLKNLTTFKIGGKAKYYFLVESKEDAIYAFKFAKKNKIKKFILGNGSNILFDDRGFSGLVIHNKINFLKIDQGYVYVGAGFFLSSLSKKTSGINLSGLEFGYSIPASVGGAVYMNASSFGQTISDTLVSIDYLTSLGKIITIDKKDIKFGYRYSGFQKKRGMILACKFKLNLDKNAKINKEKFFQKKCLCQPLETKNAGCIFKNPNNLSAWQLIEKCGFKNYAIGGAKISAIHSNFIINQNNATSKNVKDLIKLVKQKVKKQENILLKEEIKIIEY